MKFILLSVIIVSSLFAQITVCDSSGKIDESCKKIMNFVNHPLILSDVSKDSAKVSMGNLKIGQSGIIVHKTSKGKNVIVSFASVVSSATAASELRFIDKQIIKQNAIPTTKLKPQDGDKFILNHLYDASLLIAPNINAKRVIQTTFEKQNFISEDFFASYLKLKETSAPSKKDIQRFCDTNHIGTLFIVIVDHLYIVDTNTFKVIEIQKLKVEDKTAKIPFYTKIEKIEESIVSFGDNKMSNYNKYYSKLLGL
ncbi:MAG: plasminogen-binding N-terminal domain-containing protein [Campylobacterota bacterium]|nr:plasminogen-binding N-terminal domain-containing protein [Campylobacterota bacterium]